MKAVSGFVKSSRFWKAWSRARTLMCFVWLVFVWFFFSSKQASNSVVLLNAASEIGVSGENAC